MSLPLRHPIVEIGDAGAGASLDCRSLGNYSAWRVDGIRDENSAWGTLYASFAPNGANVDVDIYSDRERATLVAQAVNAPITARVTAAPVGLSRLTVSCLVAENTASDQVAIVVQLASLEDISRREEDAAAFFQGTAPILRFNTIAEACMRQLYLNVQATFPPPQRASAPLGLYSSNRQTAGKKGLPDVDAADFWSLNPEGDWELTGLQNVADFKEWAIAWTLAEMWERRAGSVDDPVLARSELYRDKASEQWALLPFLVDYDGDGTPEREVRRSTPLLGRG